MDLAIVGMGKIAQDQHLPAAADSAFFSLAAIVDQRAVDAGVPVFGSIEDLVASGFRGAVAICTPPAARFDIARVALEAGLHTLLEKPPGLATSEVDQLADLARRNAVTLFAAWHSREAAMVAPAKAYLAERQVHDVAISWREDIRRWHPGQNWILDEGGFGVFDPGINALSILTEIVGEPITLLSAELEVPSNKQAPIGATLGMATASGAAIDTVFDWRQTGPQTWDIAVETDNGSLLLSEGGNTLRLDGEVQMKAPDEEYPAMYRRFVDLVERRAIDVDTAPLRLVADAFLCGRHCPTAAFED